MAPSLAASMTIPERVMAALSSRWIWASLPGRVATQPEWSSSSAMAEISSPKSSLAISVGLATSQLRTDPSFEPERTCLPRPRMAVHVTGRVWPRRTRTGSWVAVEVDEEGARAEWTRIVPARVAERVTSPDGKKVVASTSPTAPESETGPLGGEHPRSTTTSAPSSPPSTATSTVEESENAFTVRGNCNGPIVSSADALALDRKPERTH